MRIATILFLFASSRVVAQPESQPFTFGDRYATDAYYIVEDDMWHIMNLDEAVKVTVERNGLIVMFTTDHNVFWMTSACGHNSKTETIDTRAAFTCVVNPPVMLPKGTQIHVTCPPGGYAHMNRTFKP